jgi:hypothetical protein
MTLLEFYNSRPVSVLWVCGVGCPGGTTYHDDPDGDDEGDADFSEFDLFDRFLGLEGEVRADGRWHWDGEGDVRDLQHNTIYNIQVW